MRKIVRSPAPDVLKDNSENWGLEYRNKKEQDPTHSFSWRQVNGIRVNHYILPGLKAMSEDHCHYCDGYPPGKADETIDHFKPKGNPEFFHLVYDWENLFLACADCQRHKMERFDDRLLRPDHPGFSFNRYFIYNYRTHEVEINKEQLNPEDFDKAEVTLKLFGFNLSNRPIARRHAWERWLGRKNQDVTDFPFRYMFE
jgi:uncharacterized protein (TIGR02646 family)